MQLITANGVYFTLGARVHPPVETWCRLRETGSSRVARQDDRRVGAQGSPSPSSVWAA